MDETKQFAFRLPTDLHLELKVKAAESRRTMNGVLLDLIQAWVRNPKVIVNDR